MYALPPLLTGCLLASSCSWSLGSFSAHTVTDRGLRLVKNCLCASGPRVAVFEYKLGLAVHADRAMQDMLAALLQDVTTRRKQMQSRQTQRKFTNAGLQLVAVVAKICSILSVVHEAL